MGGLRTDAAALPATTEKAACENMVKRQNADAHTSGHDGGSEAGAGEPRAPTQLGAERRQTTSQELRERPRAIVPGFGDTRISEGMASYDADAPDVEAARRVISPNDERLAAFGNMCLRPFIAKFN